jgi:hypothetical protein
LSRIRRGIAASLSIPGFALAAHAAELPPWGRILRMERPEYPRAALDRGVSGTIDVVGIVASGPLAKIVYIPATPYAEIFLPAVGAVVPRWHVSGEGSGCFPQPETVRFRIEFALEEGQGRVFITQAEGSRPVMIDPVAPAATMRKIEAAPSQNRQPPHYPASMVRAGTEARVFALVSVDPDGKVGDVRSRAYPIAALRTEVLARGSPLPTRVELPSGDDLRPFTDEVERTLRQWEFSAERAVWRGCYEVVFRLKD